MGNAVILDKTGTITEGKPLVTDILWAESNKDIRKYELILLAIETQSEHPLAEAVVNHFKEQNVQPTEIASFESITGMGVRAELENGTQYFVGNHKLMVENDIQIDAALKEASEKLEDKAKTVIFFGDDTHVLSILAI